MFARGIGNIDKESGTQEDREPHLSHRSMVHFTAFGNALVIALGYTPSIASFYHILRSCQ